MQRTTMLNVQLYIQYMYTVEANSQKKSHVAFGQYSKVRIRPVHLKYSFPDSKLTNCEALFTEWI